MQDRHLTGDTAPEVFRKQLHQLADWIADFRQHIGELRVAPNNKPGAIRAALPSQPPEEGEEFDKILGDIDRLIVPGMVHWSHPMFLGYFGWTQTGPGILGEIATAPLNVNAMMWRTSPAATELETLVVDWVRQWMGLPEQFGGVVYDTASVGIMHALAVAREEAAPSTRKLGLSGRDLPRFRVYASDQAHSSVEKAAIALGLGEENVQRVPTDTEFRMDVAALRAMIERDSRSRDGGIKPLAAVAMVGTTSTASVDPVSDIAKICREHKIWLHVDAAYGGGFAILPEYEWITKGWSDADSIVINPHKTLFVPLDFSLLYVRDLERLRRVFTLVPEYLRGDTIEAEKNYMDYGIQLGRRFRALKAWVIWRSLGRAGMAARLRDQIRLANLLVDWIKADKRFELSAPVVMPVICFRLVAANEALRRSVPPVPFRQAQGPELVEGRLGPKADVNSEIVERINTSGRAYLTQTKLRGQTVMRIGLGNVLTTEAHVRDVWELIQQVASDL